VTREVPGALSTVLAITAVTWKRLLRGRALAMGAVLALVPVAFAAGMRGAEVTRGLVPNLFLFELLIVSVMSPMFVASSIGDEIEDRTITYLWSRPVPRWAVLLGKLAALVPIALALLAASWSLGMELGVGHGPAARSYAALAAGVAAVAMIAAGLALLVPRHGMALTVCYMLLDATVSNIPASIENLTVSYNVRAIAQVPPLLVGDAATSAIWLAVIAVGWLGIGLWRIRRLEA